MRCIGSDNCEAIKAEVGHGPSHGADVERIARRDQDDVEPVALEGSGQEPIVEPGMQAVGWPEFHGLFPRTAELPDRLNCATWGGANHLRWGQLALARLEVPAVS